MRTLDGNPVEHCDRCGLQHGVADLYRCEKCGAVVCWKQVVTYAKPQQRGSCNEVTLYHDISFGVKVILSQRYGKKARLMETLCGPLVPCFIGSETTDGEIHTMEKHEIER